MNRLLFSAKKIKELLTGKSNPLATTPRKFTFNDWKSALLATKSALGNKRIGLLAAGSAYFSTLAFFPLMAAAVAISSFFIQKNNLNDIVSTIEQFLPADIASLLSTQVEQALGNPSSSFIVAIVAILISLFSVSGAVQNVISALNVTYGLKDESNFLKARLTSLSLMGCGLIGGAIVILLLLMNTPLLVGLGIPSWLAQVLSITRWVALLVLITVLLAVVYRYGPNKPNPQWQWVSWGSVIASTLWMLATVAFFIYARYFANFSDSYSTFAGIIVLMTWLNLTAYMILLGAEINNQLERQSLVGKSAK